MKMSAAVSCDAGADIFCPESRKCPTIGTDFVREYSHRKLTGGGEDMGAYALITAVVGIVALAAKFMQLIGWLEGERR